MDPASVLSNHLLCEGVYKLLLEENSWLKIQKSVPSKDILDRKQQLLPQLEQSLVNLRKLKPEFFSPFDNSKKLVNDSHAKLLQIFYIDKENEELLVKITQPVGQNFNWFTTPPEKSMRSTDWGMIKNRILELRIKSLRITLLDCEHLKRNILVDSNPKFKFFGKVVAEGEGFEPPNRCRFSGFQDRRIRPLCHPSEKYDTNESDS